MLIALIVALGDLFWFWDSKAGWTILLSMLAYDAPLIGRIVVYSMSGIIAGFVMLSFLVVLFSSPKILQAYRIMLPVITIFSWIFFVYWYWLAVISIALFWEIFLCFREMFLSIENSTT